ncbi:MAG TPA: hypothetical protein VIS04_04565 [Woeseiaceae bacterium]
MKYLAQVLAYGAFMLLVGVFSAWPDFALRKAGEGKVTLAFSHAGQLLGECRQLSQEELQALPPNMRNPLDCPRGRHDVVVSFVVDGEEVFSRAMPPTGVWGDGEASIYHRLPMAGGAHSVFIGMADSGRESGFDYELDTALDVRDGDHIVIEFDALARKFILKGSVDAID